VVKRSIQGEIDGVESPTRYAATLTTRHSTSWAAESDRLTETMSNGVGSSGLSSDGYLNRGVTSERDTDRMVWPSLAVDNLLQRNLVPPTSTQVVRVRRRTCLLCTDRGAWRSEPPTVGRPTIIDTDASGALAAASRGLVEQHMLVEHHQLLAGAPADERPPTPQAPWRSCTH
jgi:hypothetical protein